MIVGTASIEPRCLDLDAAVEAIACADLGACFFPDGYRFSTSSIILYAPWRSLNSEL